MGVLLCKELSFVVHRLSSLISYTGMFLPAIYCNKNYHQCFEVPVLIYSNVEGKVSVTSIDEILISPRV